MTTTARIHVLEALAALFVLVPPVAAETMQPGMWSLAMIAEADGPPQALPEVKQCISQQDIDDESRTLPRPNGKCTLTNIQRSETRTTYDLACMNGPVQSRGRAEVRFAGDHYDGAVVMALSDRGRPAQRLLMKISAKRIGDCTK